MAPLLKAWLFVLAIFYATDHLAQESSIIPNPGFEEFEGFPLGWFYNGQQFTRLMKYWYSPTLASPDVFGPDVIVPSHWQKKGFGNQQPYEGRAMVGLTVYGCGQGKPHCREYLQIELNESLVVGQKYELKFHIAHLENSLYINNLGAYFTSKPLKTNTDRLIKAEPQINSQDIINPGDNEWYVFQKSFIADSAFNYLTIGNFYSDDACEVQRSDNNYEFAYYYFDDFSLRKAPPIVPVFLPEDDLSKQTFTLGNTIELKNIYFDTDMCNLLPRSYNELNKLVQILTAQPEMAIEVHGHTDIQGESGYNYELSSMRARAVYNYLIESGINASRLNYKGFGSNLPIADNTSEEGRKLNRRVEILIVGL